MQRPGDRLQAQWQGFLPYPSSPLTQQQIGSHTPVWSTPPGESMGGGPGLGVKQSYIQGLALLIVAMRPYHLTSRCLGFPIYKCVSQFGLIFTSQGASGSVWTHFCLSCLTGCYWNQWVAARCTPKHFTEQRIASYSKDVSGPKYPQVLRLGSHVRVIVRSH